MTQSESENIFSASVTFPSFICDAFLICTASLPLCSSLSDDLPGLDVEKPARGSSPISLTRGETQRNNLV